MMGCEVCERIKMIKEGSNNHFVQELETGYVVMGDYQLFEGYTLFLCKQHYIELHDMPHELKMKHLEEMSLVAQAVYNAFKPDKMNYELLGNRANTHLHWHFFPRRDGDTPSRGPVWWLGKEKLYDEKNKPTEIELDRLIKKVRYELSLLIK